MAITTVDGIVAGLQPGREFIKAQTPNLLVGRPQSLFYLPGIPGAAAAPTPGVSGEALTAYDGQLYFGNPSSGNAYLARFQASATTNGQLLLCDRLWHNSGMSISSTSPQAINSVAWPARDANGSTNGDGVLVAVETSQNTGASNLTATLDYTNSAGTSGRVATSIINTSTSQSLGSFYPIGLQSGDSGVRSIQNVTWSSSWFSGMMHLVAYRVIARLDLPIAAAANAIDAVTGGMPRAFNNTVPFLVFIPATTTNSAISGHLVWTHG